MAISFLTPSRTVLLIGDEALYVYKVTHNAASLVDSVPWQTEDFEDFVAGLVRKECGGRPILVLNDMTDQHFKGGQRLPKVGLMDRSNVLSRKIQVAFPNYPVRGALPVKVTDKKSSKDGDKSQGKGLYLFAAVPASDQITKTLLAVRLSMAPVAGFVLLPVESSDMALALSVKLAGKGRKVPRWTVFIGQHQNGALRQVITRDGQLAMTRMTPVSDADSDPEVWAREVHQEFKATVGYLSRFGYSQEDGTDVIVICNKEAGSALEKLIESPCKYKAFTTPEAARLLGMPIGRQDETRYAEPLHVAWAGRKAKFTLPMEATEIKKIHGPRQMVAAAVLLMVLGGGYQAYQLVSLTQSLFETRGDYTVQRGVLTQAESEHQAEVKRMEALGFDVNLIQGAITAYESFESDRMKVVPLFQKIGEALGSDLRLDAIAVDRIAPVVVEVPGAEPSADQTAQPVTVETKLSLSFPPTIQLEFGIREISNLRKRLAERLPEYDVEITRQIARPEYTQNIKGVAGRTAEEIAVEEDYVAELTIRGPKK